MNKIIPTEHAEKSSRTDSQTSELKNMTCTSSPTQTNKQFTYEWKQPHWTCWKVIDNSNTKLSNLQTC